ncbi:MAG: hypothetical protein WC538_05860 [Thermoanaerobaculia bacterium]|jgi:hypothetical protein
MADIVQRELDRAIGSAPADRSAAGRADTITWSLAAAAIALLLLAWTFGVERRGFDYDELEHAHTVWMMSEGLRPFADFLQGHPPFPWYAFEPLTRGATDTLRLMLELRVASGATHVAMILLCIANMRIGRAAIPLPWTAAGVLVMLAGRPNIDYLIDFRPDSLATIPLLAGTLLLGLRLPRNATARYVLASLLGVTSILCSPKLFVFWGIFAVVELAALFRSDRPAVLRAVASHVGGAAFAAAMGAAVLLVQGIDPIVAYSLTIRFHALLGTNAAFGHGLAMALPQQAVLLLLIAGGAFCWAALCRKVQLRPSAFEITVIVFLPLQAAIVPFPYKQYFVPWFLLGATFVHFIPAALARVSLRVARLAAAAILLLALSAGMFAAAGMAEEDGLRLAGDYWALLESSVPATGRVVASVPLHPITRLDACYGWMRSGDPSGRYETVEAMRDLNLPGYSERFTAPWFDRELEAARPVLIATGPVGDYRLASAYAAAVADYARRHAAEYSAIKVRNGTLLVRKPERPAP